MMMMKMMSSTSFQHPAELGHSIFAAVSRQEASITTDDSQASKARKQILAEFSLLKAFLSLSAFVKQAKKEGNEEEGEGREKKEGYSYPTKKKRGKSQVFLGNC